MKTFKFLILVDLQNDFLEDCHSIGIFYPDQDHHNVIIESVSVINSTDWDGIWITKDTHFSDYFTSLEGKIDNIEHCQYLSRGWEVNRKVMESIANLQVTVETVVKTTFGSYDLVQSIGQWFTSKCGPQFADAFARGDNIEFHICGIHTSRSVLSNAVMLRAAYQNSTIVVHKNACADETGDLHNAALDVMRRQYCTIV